MAIEGYFHFERAGLSWLNWFATATRSDLCIPRNETCAASLPISTIHASVNDLYIPTIGTLILLQPNRRIDWEYINRSQKDECKNWQRGRPRRFISGNICFQFSAQCPCNVIWVGTDLSWFELFGSGQNLSELARTSMA